MKSTLSLALGLLICSCSGNRGEVATESNPQLQFLNSPAKSPSSVPHLFTDKKGKVYLSWVEKSGKINLFKFSDLQGEVWSEPKLITSGDTWFLNWADYPMIVSDGEKNLVSHVLNKNGEGTYSYEVKMYASTDYGNSWESPFILHDDGKQAEHGFVSLVPYESDVFVSWLDGRNTVMEEMDHSKMEDQRNHGAMSLRAAILNYSGKKIKEWELDNKTCDCCQTTAVITQNGPVVIYRDRSDDEIRDMSIVRLVDGVWTKPKPVFNDNWKISGCPVNGPRSSAVGNDLAIAWFSAADSKPLVNVIFSKDGGATFSEPVRVDEGKPNGRVDVEMLDSTSCMVTWMEDGNIKVVKVNVDGSKGPPIDIATSSEARSSGFPQMTKSADKLIFAWTDDKEKIVHVASLPL
jgi:hypothetical protein